MRKFGAARIATSLAILACGLIACESFGGETRDPAPFEPFEQDASSATDAGPSDAAPDPETSTSEEPGPMTCEEAKALVPRGTLDVDELASPFSIHPVDVYVEEIGDRFRIVLTEQPDECALRRGIAARPAINEDVFEIRRLDDAASLPPLGKGVYSTNSENNANIRISNSQIAGQRCLVDPNDAGPMAPANMSGPVDGHITIRSRSETSVEGTIDLTQDGKKIYVEFNAPICRTSAHVPALCCE